MSREIKFRFWTGLNMINHTELRNDKYTIAQLSSPIYTPMQFTGLKDKNGKEIYEGDIVQRKENSYDKSTYISKYEVAYKENFFCLKTIQSHIFKNGAIISVMHGLEVIGNIYENKELLT